MGGVWKPLGQEVSSVDQPCKCIQFIGMPHSSLELKALVTGGAGFIGSHIAQALCARGARVTVLDDLSTGDDSANLAWAGAGDQIDFVKGCITDRALVTKLVQGCDWVFHEAGH